MPRLVAVVCSVAFLCTCDKKVAVPAFQIQITLSEAATKKLSDAHETIKCAVWFDGDGHSRPGEYTAPERPVVLSGRYEFELDQPGVVSVDHATISEEAFERLTDTDYYYTVNVYSGRRVFKNNVLDGGYAGGHISEATKKPVEITCDLLPSH